jgi:hypothetical protein
MSSSTAKFNPARTANAEAGRPMAVACSDLLSITFNHQPNKKHEQKNTSTINTRRKEGVASQQKSWQPIYLRRNGPQWIPIPQAKIRRTGSAHLVMLNAKS